MQRFDDRFWLARLAAVQGVLTAIYPAILLGDMLRSTTSPGFASSAAALAVILFIPLGVGLFCCFQAVIQYLFLLHNPESDPKSSYTWSLLVFVPLLFIRFPIFPIAAAVVHLFSALIAVPCLVFVDWLWRAVPPLRTG